MGLVPLLMEVGALEVREHESEVVRPVADERAAGDELETVLIYSRPVAELSEVGALGL